MYDQTRGAIANLRSGDMVLYPYLWSWQKAKGLQTGEKLRPSLVIHNNKSGQLVICGITTCFVKPPRRYIPIPGSECVRGGLHNHDRSKIVLSECNIDDVNNIENFGPKINASFSSGFLKMVRHNFLGILQSKACNAVRREIAPEPEMDKSEEPERVPEPEISF